VNTTGSALHHRNPGTWRWKGHNVVLVDGTTVLMPDTEANQNAFPQQSSQKPGLGFPIARVVGLISLGVGSVIDYIAGPYQGKGSGESSLFSQLIGTLRPGELLLADRYYCTYAIIALLMQKGVNVLFENHAQRKPDFRRGKKLGVRDHLIEWHKPKRKPVWMSKDDYDTLPQSIKVRELRVQGIVYITTLMASKKYHKKTLAQLYTERWKVDIYQPYCLLKCVFRGVERLKAFSTIRVARCATDVTLSTLCDPHRPTRRFGLGLLADVH
jgi:hypothetical protein